MKPWRFRGLPFPSSPPASPIRSPFLRRRKLPKKKSAIILSFNRGIVLCFVCVFVFFRHETSTMCQSYAYPSEQKNGQRFLRPGNDEENVMTCSRADREMCQQIRSSEWSSLVEKQCKGEDPDASWLSAIAVYSMKRPGGWNSRGTPSRVP